MNVIKSDEFKDKLGKIDNYIAFFVYHMLIDEDVMDGHVYHLSYFTNLYRKYYSAKITQQSFLNEISKIYLDESDYKLKGFRQQEKKLYEIDLNEMIEGLIDFVDIQFNKVKELQNVWI